MDVLYEVVRLALRMSDASASARPSLFDVLSALTASDSAAVQVVTSCGSTRELLELLPASSEFPDSWDGVTTGESPGTSAGGNEAGHLAPAQ